MHVSPQSLRDAAVVFDRLATTIDELPAIDGKSLKARLAGSAIGRALGDAEDAHRGASTALKHRLQNYSALLNHSANSYSRIDSSTADKLSKIVADQLSSLSELDNAAGPASNSQEIIV